MAEYAEPTDGKKDTAAIKSARRVLEVFEFFAQRRGPASVGEISKALNYPQSSTSVLMRCLHELRYMHYDAQQRLYRPTLRLALTSSWLREENFSGVELTSLMTELRDRTEGSVVLGIQNDVDLQYIQVIPARVPVQFVMRIGQVRPICGTAVGKALLAELQDVKVSAIVRRINARRSCEHPIDLRGLLAELAEIRRTGLASSVNAASPGASVIAAVIPLSKEDVPMAVGVGGPSEFIDVRRSLIEDTLRELLHLQRP